jgi:hypothetical protein
LKHGPPVVVLFNEQRLVLLFHLRCLLWLCHIC